MDTSMIKTIYDTVRVEVNDTFIIYDKVSNCMNCEDMANGFGKLNLAVIMLCSTIVILTTFISISILLYKNKQTSNTNS